MQKLELSKLSNLQIRRKIAFLFTVACEISAPRIGVVTVNKWLFINQLFILVGNSAEVSESSKFTPKPFISAELVFDKSLPSYWFSAHIPFSS